MAENKQFFGKRVITVGQLQTPDEGTRIRYKDGRAAEKAKSMDKAGRKRLSDPMPVLQLDWCGSPMNEVDSMETYNLVHSPVFKAPQS